MSKIMQNLTWIILASAIAIALLITVLDAGGSASQGSGAGDIWWVDAVEVEQSYQNLVQNK